MTKDYRIKKYRVRAETINIIKYLEWKAMTAEGRDKFFLDRIITTYFPRILNKEILVLKEKKKGREDRSIILKNTTHDLISSTHKSVHFTMGEIIEVCLFVYAQEHLTLAEIKHNGLDKWEISYRVVNSK